MTIKLDALEDRTKVRELQVSNLPFSDNTACVWEFVDRLDGLYRKFNRDTLRIRIDQLVSMDIFLAVGEDRSESILYKNTANIKVG